MLAECVAQSNAFGTLHNDIDGMFAHHHCIHWNDEMMCPFVIIIRNLFWYVIFTNTTTKKCYGLFSQKFRNDITGIRVHEVVLNSKRPKFLLGTHRMLPNQVNKIHCALKKWLAFSNAIYKGNDWLLLFAEHGRNNLYAITRVTGNFICNANPYLSREVDFATLHGHPYYSSKAGFCGNGR